MSKNNKKFYRRREVLLQDALRHEQLCTSQQPLVLAKAAAPIDEICSDSEGAKAMQVLQFLQHL